MFGIPGTLLEYSAPGSSLTYQNVTEVWNEFLKGCLLPNYLEPIEQGLGDLLPRSMVVSFYTQGLLRADIKTRYDVYASGITSGVLTQEKAQEMEGLIAGNPENAPVPASAPASVPYSVPLQIRSVRGGPLHRPPNAPRSDGDMRQAPLSGRALWHVPAVQDEQRRVNILHLHPGVDTGGTSVRRQGRARGGRGLGPGVRPIASSLRLPRPRDVGRRRRVGVHRLGGCRGHPQRAFPLAEGVRRAVQAPRRPPPRQPLPPSSSGPLPAWARRSARSRSSRRSTC